MSFVCCIVGSSSSTVPLTPLWILTSINLLRSQCNIFDPKETQTWSIMYIDVEGGMDKCRQIIERRGQTDKILWQQTTSDHGQTQTMDKFSTHAVRWHTGRMDTKHKSIPLYIDSFYLKPSNFFISIRTIAIAVRQQKRIFDM